MSERRVSKSWFHIEHVPAEGETVELDGAEARHALGARRLEVGDALTLFDGRGVVAVAVIDESAARRAVVRIQTRRVEAELEPSVQLIFAPPRGDRLSTLLSMTTQLGVTRLSPVVTTRGVSKPGAAFDRRAAKICMEACKQARRAWVPRIDSPRPLSQAAAEAADAGARLLIAHPGGVPSAELGPAGPTAIVIGPEGGLDEAEVETLVAMGGQAVDLGSTILRIETAAVAAVALARLA